VATRCYSYLRFSSSEQARGDSLRRDFFACLYSPISFASAALRNEYARIIHAYLMSLFRDSLELTLFRRGKAPLIVFRHQCVQPILSLRVQTLQVCHRLRVAYEAEKRSDSSLPVQG